MLVRSSLEVGKLQRSFTIYTPTTCSQKVENIVSRYRKAGPSRALTIVAAAFLAAASLFSVIGATAGSASATPTLYCTIVTPYCTISASTLTYPWSAAPCADTSYKGNTSGPCPGYNWGMNPCPANDGYCNSTNSLNGYYLYDQWGYGFRNCTSYVAWVLAQDGVPTKDFNFSSIGDGNAYQWLIEAESSQWPQLNALTSNNPNAYQDNAVAVTTGNANNPGHVMFVVNANPGPTGYITVDEYNQDTQGDGDVQTNTPAALGIVGYIYYQSLMTPVQSVLPQPAVVPVNGAGTISGFTGGWTAFATTTNGQLEQGWETAPGSSWTWGLLNGTPSNLTGSPAVVPVNGAGTISGFTGGWTVFAITTNNQLEQGWETAPGSNWSWASTGGSNLTGSPAIVPILGAGSIAGITGGWTAFAVTTSGQLEQGWETAPGSNWSWAILTNSPSNLTGTPVVVPVNGAGTISGFTGGWTVFVLTTNGQLEQGWQTQPGSTWSWGILTSSPSNLTGTPVVVPVNNAGTIPGITGGWTAFTLNTGTDLEQGWQTQPGSTWSWQDTGVPTLTGSPAVVPVNGAGTIPGITGGWSDFALTTNGQLEQGWQTQPGSLWSDAVLTSSPNNLTSSPVVVPVNGAGTISGFTGGWTAFAITTNNQLEQGWETAPGSTWSWQSTGGSNLQ